MNTGGELSRIEEPTPPVAVDHITRALDAGVSVEVIERLVALQERTEDRHARAAFFRAKHDFQALTHAIEQNRTVDHATKTGGRKRHTFADLAQITETIRGPMSDCGLSYSWDVVDGICYCTVAHVDGHTDTKQHPVHQPGVPGANAAQNYAAGVTYAKRYSLLNALGIVTADPDTDGSEVDGAPITEAQMATLLDHIHSASEETNVPVPDVVRRFLKVLGVTQLADLDSARYPFALAKIQERKN